MKEKTLYLECFSGISGDMTVSALLDLGVDESLLLNALHSLPFDGYRIEISRIIKCGIDACHFKVHLEPSHDNSHDHAHNHSHDHSHNHAHNHSHDHAHNHSHDHSHNHAHSCETRNIHDIYHIIDHGTLTHGTKKLAKTMFDYVARAESKAHGLPVEKVHFHEVGAVDSIVDIVAVAFCIDHLNITNVCVSTVYEGQGFVKCQHGVIPVPVPAVLNIAQECGISMKITDTTGEMITPTGMAIVAALKTMDQLPEPVVFSKIGIGGGTKNFKHANILRAMLVETDTTSKELRSLYLLETNVDDCTGEALGFIMEVLLEQGGLDVFYTPIFMKKNRPATTLSVLCSEDLVDTMEDMMYTHLSTLGIRRIPCLRSALPRVLKSVPTRYGEVQFKVATHREQVYAYPEYEDVRTICRTHNLPFEETYHQIKADYEKE